MIRERLSIGKCTQIALDMLMRLGLTKRGDSQRRRGSGDSHISKISRDAECHTLTDENIIIICSVHKLHGDRDSQRDSDVRSGCRQEETELRVSSVPHAVGRIVAISISIPSEIAILLDVDTSSHADGLVLSDTSQRLTI